ncbi:MAG: YggS family pyridoxal phosphate-dependent enzyme [Paludibacteraceae bacterium]|nr:YggS family pyridoxal phosphate-dependent enzyme [Paludibacteraceae bacterium]
MSVTTNITALRQTIPDGVTLLCVSKFHPAEAVAEAYRAGERDFGESRVQELTGKVPVLPSDIRWHFIGHLQTNKVRQIVPFVHLIHGVDSLHLLRAIEAESRREERPEPVRVLLEVHVAQEASKQGFSKEELLDLLQEGSWRDMTHLHICGLMGMASLTDDNEQIRSEFRGLHELFSDVKHRWFAGEPTFSILSMGMSGDYRIAIEEGSTMVRIGTGIFGERNYNR